MQVVPSRIACAKEVAAARSGGQPTRSTAARAREALRSAMPTTCSPGVRGACDKNIEPNFPAPMTPTRTGVPASASAASLRDRLMDDLPTSLSSRRRRTAAAP
jgi:hypothetical protein